MTSPLTDRDMRQGGSPWPPTANGPPSAPAPKLVRSKDGCLTCKHRKVKCNEQRPTCSHCERLNLQCKWQSRSSVTARRRLNETAGGGTGGIAAPVPHSPFADKSTPSNASASSPQLLHAVDEVFDYAGFMWDSGDFWQGQAMNLALDAEVVPSSRSHVEFPGRATPLKLPLEPPPSASVPADGGSVVTRGWNNRMMDYFARSAIPPILAEAETQKNWQAMRQVVVEMASTSKLVRCAIMAFSNVLLSRREGQIHMAVQQNHYDSAVAEVAACDSTPLGERGPRRENLLAALFFLSYVDILECRLDAARSNLKRAHQIFQLGDKGSSFTSVEKQFLSWIRLLDARAVSAGGEGLFLSEDYELLLVGASPAATPVGGGPEDPKNPDLGDGDIEDVLFQVLYQPGIVFYQKVQSFMGRISMIDPWHRSRGTVEDETEVMNLGAAIATDLRTLYDQRPLLMDYAVSGKLTEPHVSANLAFAITRAFRTYLSNYYASKLHLHRVAYKNLPLTKEASDALDHIRRLARLLVQGLDAEEPLPVNMLWPLLMLGVEEQDAGERVWIRTQILRMEKVAGNARITAQVLEEVQARQDATKARVDIRSVMHHVFNASFAIL